MENKKVTSEKIASLAAQVLANKNSSDIAKKLAGSALSQVTKGNETGSSMEDLASKALKSEKYSKVVKSLAASVLAQSNKKR